MMSNKITLITPPDFYENENFSILFLGLTEDQQEEVSQWLGKQESLPETNIYFYQGEPNAPWLLYALNRANVKFLNYDTEYAIINLLGSYALSKPQTYYTTDNLNLKELMCHINNKFVPDITTFLEKVFCD